MLRSRVLRGFVWVFASQVGLQLARAIAAIAIARMLTTAEYGLAALALVCAGALGNLIDRLRSLFGVVDFIDVGVGDSRWPTFNAPSPRCPMRSPTPAST